MTSRTSGLSFRDQVRRRHIHSCTRSYFDHTPPDVADTTLTDMKTTIAKKRKQRPESGDLMLPSMGSILDNDIEWSVPDAKFYEILDVRLVNNLDDYP